MPRTGMMWVKDPGHGGRPIPPLVRLSTQERLGTYAHEHVAGRYTELSVHFRGPLCYVDLFTEPALPENWPPPDGDETREEAIAR